MYVTEYRNDQYVYHNDVMTTAIPNDCLTLTTTRECLSDKKRAQEVCEPTGESLLARVDYV